LGALLLRHDKKPPQFGPTFSNALLGFVAAPGLILSTRDEGPWDVETVLLLYSLATAAQIGYYMLGYVPRQARKISGLFTWWCVVSGLTFHGFAWAFFMMDLERSDLVVIYASMLLLSGVAIGRIWNRYLDGYV